MPSREVRFRYTEATRLMRAATAAGLPVKGITIKNGQPYVEIEQGGAAASGDKATNPWDKVPPNEDPQRPA
jgi:hypothetical protein